MLWQIVVQLGKLNLWVQQLMGSISTEALISNPACSSPSDKPPAPAKKSKTNGFFTRVCFDPTAASYLTDEVSNRKQEWR